MKKKLVKSKNPSRKRIPRVLIIEPDERFVDLYKKFFDEYFPAEVVYTNSGKNISNLLNESEFQLIITEMYFTDGDGIDVIRKVKKEFPYLSVVVVTGFATIENAVLALKNGADQYYRKPFNFDEFKLALKKELEKEIVFTSDNKTASFFSVFQTCQSISTALDEERIFEEIYYFFKKEFKTTKTAIYTNQKHECLQIYPEKKLKSLPQRIGTKLKKFVSSQEKKGVFIGEDFIAFKFRSIGNFYKTVVSFNPEINEEEKIINSKLNMLQMQIHLAGKNIEHYQEVKHLSYVDDVTGLYNTRYLSYILDKKIDEAKKLKEAFAVLFIDMDHFKNINDGFGHVIGSKLLFEVGEQIKKCLREDDTTFRYGGDEFVAIISNASLDTSKLIASRICEAVSKKKFLARENMNIKLTLSIGVALYPLHAKSKKEILAAADSAMYEVKKTTRNSVFIFKPSKKAGKKGHLEAQFEKA